MHTHTLHMNDNQLHLMLSVIIICLLSVRTTLGVLLYDEDDANNKNNNYD